MKKYLIAFIVTCIVMFTGCVRPPNYPGVVSIQTNELAFLVDMTGEGSVAGADSAVQRKDISIPTYWVKTGRWNYVGYWRPSVKVITVSQAPARLDWDQRNDTKTIRMTSSESSGFIVPIVINAFIDTRADAEKYLKAFKPISDDKVDWSQLSPKEWGPYAKESAQPLETALNTVVFAKTLEQLAQLFVKTPVLYAEKASKIYVPAVFDGITAAELTRKVTEAGITDSGRPLVFSSDVDSIKEWAKTIYGITITVASPGDGVIYDNKDVQIQIDSLAAGVMKEKTLAQDQVNAQAQQRVAVVNAETERRVAEQKAATASALRVLQEIENDKLIAQATAKAIESGNVTPVGAFPKGLTTLIITPNYNDIGSRR